MTRYYLPIMLLAAAMTVAGCNKENNELPIEEGTYEFVLNAQAPDLGSRVTYENDMIFSWSKNDEISVLFHKGSDNKFFTLKAASAGASSVFKGSVTNGYVLGSDTNEKLAFFPAGSHSYVGGTVTYNIPSEIDFTASHYTAHVPMAAVGDDDNTFVFKPIASIVKFSFSNVKASKVRFTAQNQKASDGAQVKLSGDFELKRSDSSPYFYYGLKWHDLGTPEGRLSYVANVSNNKVSFYLPVPAWNGDYFIPEITLEDANNGAKLYTATAKNGLPSGSTSSLGSIVVLPEIKAHAPEAWSFPSAYDIKWNDEPIAAEGEGAANLLKLKADANYLYLYLEVKKSFLPDAEINTYEGRAFINIWNGEEGVLLDSWIKYKHAPMFKNWAAWMASQSAVEHVDLYCYEVAIKRSEIGQLADGTARVFVTIDNDWCYNPGTGEIWGHKEDPDNYGLTVGRAPAGEETALEISLP